jgi:hypothetical protein
MSYCSVLFRPFGSAASRRQTFLPVARLRMLAPREQRARLALRMRGTLAKHPIPRLFRAAPLPGSDVVDQ